jgi:hypothetical protein
VPYQYANGMSINLRSIASAGLFVLGGLLLGGCEGRGSPPDVPAGEFTAYVRGAVSDTIAGPVHYRVRGDSLVGLELGAKNGPGLSIELEPQPPALRTYEVVDAELFGTTQTGSSSGVMAFLTTGEARFEATDGTLELTYVNDERVGATFTFQMEGEFVEGPSERPAVKATGALNAPPER